MTTITIEAPDELAVEIKPMREHLPAILYEVFQMRGMRTKLPKANQAYPVWQEMIDFLASGPTTTEIIACRSSGEAQSRVADLLEKNRSGTLTEAEESELNGCKEVENLMGILKARAQSKK